ncbi:putative hemolysin-H1C [Staphylococcus xylosus]|nr:beta-class phenol-soluble modulin [Staphylococcus xylosus]SCU37064.1 putative hemolysin-H1C [Staphylococcus xylosus]
MNNLFDSIRGIVNSAISNDDIGLGENIVNTVQAAVELLLKPFGL